MSGWLLGSTAFCAAAVEAVEALTIVLAVGAARSWRSALSGAAWGLVSLAALGLVFGPAIVRFVPYGPIETGVGLLLLVFGLGWLRKAILRYAGRKALRDEAAIYARERRALAAAAAQRGDTLGFAAAYNAVLLEGLEVVLIVVTFGAASRAALAWSAAGAVAAVLTVTAAGAALRRPLSRVPENALKFAVGLMLASFGTFWSGEGLGIAWWGRDAALAPIAAAYLVAAGATILAARRTRPALRSVA